MLQIRRQDGTVIPVAKDEAIEVLDERGRLAVVVITRKPSDSINILTPGDPFFTGYRKAQGLQTSDVQVHEPFKGAPMGG